MLTELSLVIRRGGAVTLISFSIQNKEFPASSGMTWNEWIDSPYNTGGYELISNEVHIEGGDGYDYTVEYNGQRQLGTYVIVANRAYSEVKQGIA